MTPPDVIISEVYGGGGNLGATLKNDFVELYNTTTSAVDVSGWSVQYFSESGTTVGATNKIVIPDGKSIPAKSHFLIQAAAGTNTGATVDLPSPDAVSEIAASGTAGKVILLTSSEDITIVLTDITSVTDNAAFKDYVPYGTTSVPVWGSAMSANTANATSASRKLIGGSYSYTQNIGHDFEVVTPTPQNTLWTSVQNPKLRTDVYTVNGTIRFNATAGQTVEVYTVIGQQIISTLATDGLNIIPVKAKGMMVVRIGGKSAKVVM
jgi:predicted extracellular nuclease